MRFQWLYLVLVFGLLTFGCGDSETAPGLTTDDCVQGERSCSADDVLMCQNGQMTYLKTCPPGTCAEGDCVATAEDVSSTDGGSSTGSDVTNCEPDCLNRECGDDGCGESCGTCPEDGACNDDGSCSCNKCTIDSVKCVAAATYQLCVMGDDSCAKWADPVACESGECNPSAATEGEVCDGCEAKCAGKQCGDNGCGGSCGDCAGSKECGDGQCQCPASACEIGKGSCTGDGNLVPCVDDGGGCGVSGDLVTCPSSKCADGACADCPNTCGDKVCGIDECGNTCGEGGCLGGQSCNVAGQCECIVDECKDLKTKCKSSQSFVTCEVVNGCGKWGAPEGCALYHECNDASDPLCQCVPQCTGKSCGEDKCGSTCGSCDSDQKCEAGQCLCAVNECAAAVCIDANSYKTCVKTTENLCGSYSELQKCAANESCKDSSDPVCQCDPSIACALKSCGDDGCDGQCAPGCESNEICQSGACVCEVDECEFNGEKECVGDSVRECTVVNGCGKWGAPIACSGAQAVCQGAGECGCELNCTGKECGSDGCGGTCGTGCGASKVCNSNNQCECVLDQCNAGQKQCANNNSVELCEEQDGCGKWSGAQFCGSGKYCNKGTCKSYCGNGSCESSQGENCSSCSSDCKCSTYEICSGSGQCVCDNQCSSGETVCYNNTKIKTCQKKSGCWVWGSATSCSTGMTCSSGQCKCQNECSSGQSACNTSGTKVKTCKKVGSCYKWGSYVSCQSGKECKSGECVAKCNENNYWKPTLDSDTDTTGKQKSQTINVSIKVEVKQDNKELDIRVCKGSGTFSSNIYLMIYDAANGKAGYSSTNFATKGKSCSNWYSMPGKYKYTEGQFFGGIWTVISPASSKTTWSSSGCTVKSNSTGTCWTGINISLKRTCLESGL